MAKENEAPQSEEPRKPEEKVQSEPEIAATERKTERKAQTYGNHTNATETAQTETDYSCRQMNIPEDYPGNGEH